jgi:hypothetical protein
VANFSGGDWRCLVSAAILLPCVGIATRWRSPARLLVWATSAKPAVRVLTADEIQRIASLVSIAANHHVLPTRCLVRSLTLARMLARRGVATDVRVGVRTDDQGFAAHAWVEWEGLPLNDTADVPAQFAILDSPGRDVSGV